MGRFHFFQFWQRNIQPLKAADDPLTCLHTDAGGASWEYECQLQEIMRPVPAVVDVFTLKEMQEATNNFCVDNLLGEGGFGRVYMGVLRSGQVVAIKQMEGWGCASQGEREFRVEVDILSRLNHPNLVRLIGYCADKRQRLLVYEFMNHGNLQERLHGILRTKTDWHTRVKVALGAARGLCHLHHSPAIGNPVIHRDFKSSNILLGDNFEAKVSDFGLAKLVPFGSKTYVSTRVLGTFGYLDPQYTATGHVTLKSDVYGFGVVLLELLTGRRAVDATQNLIRQNLVTQVKGKLRWRRRLRQIVDPEISKRSYNVESVAAFAGLAARCVRQDGSRRPSMIECVKELEHILLRSPPLTKT